MKDRADYQRILSPGAHGPYVLGDKKFEFHGILWMRPSTLKPGQPKLVRTRLMAHCTGERLSSNPVRRDKIIEGCTHNAVPFVIGEGDGIAHPIGSFGKSRGDSWADEQNQILACHGCRVFGPFGFFVGSSGRGRGMFPCFVLRFKNQKQALTFYRGSYAPC